MEGKPEKWFDTDTQALMDNILTDYAGRFDMFRELIQNSDDQEAKEIEICFETEDKNECGDDPSGPRVHKLVIRDNGKGLVGDQWKNLCTIARQNKDPDKVGTFGVGFYTVFGVCDEPLIKSNGRYLKLSRNNEPVFGHITHSDTDGRDTWTSVELRLRDDCKRPLSHRVDLARFLVSSITFLETVDTITVTFAGTRILGIRKHLKDGLQVDIPPVKDNSGMMAITSIKSAEQTVLVDVVGDFFQETKLRSSEETLAVQDPVSLAQAPKRKLPPPPKENSDYMVSYCLYTAQIDPPEKWKGRTTESVMKTCAREFECKAVYFDAKQQKAAKESLIKCFFDGPDGILPQNNSGRIFIGQSTKVSTGVALHVSSKRIIPEMSRNSVRMTDSLASEWNKSLLKTAGVLAQAIYEQQMHSAVQVQQLDLHTMQRFTFDWDGETSPMRYLQLGFLSVSEQRVLSNSGILKLSDIRRYDAELHPIFEKIPYLHTGPSGGREDIEEAWEIRPIRWNCMLNEFLVGNLSEAGMEKFIAWLAKREKPPNFWKRLCNEGQLNCEKCGPIKLKDIKRYTQLAHRKEHLPPKTIYLGQAQKQNHADYLRLFGWKPLEPVSWLAYACKLIDAIPELELTWDEVLNRLETSTAYTNDDFLLCLADMIAHEHLSDKQITDLRTRNIFYSQKTGKHTPTVLYQRDALGGGPIDTTDLPILVLREGTSVDKDFLKRLGVRLYPPLAEIDKWLAASDKTRFDVAIRYLKENGTNYNEEAKGLNGAFVPAEGGVLAHRNEVSTCPGGEELLFQFMVYGLKNETSSVKMTEKWFEYLTQCISDLKQPQLDELKQVQFIAFPDTHLLAATKKCLKDCFPMSSLPSDKPRWRELLPFVEFGDDGNLATWTAKKELPKTSDIAEAMIHDPKRFLELAGVDCYERYLEAIAKEFDWFDGKLKDTMRETPILLWRRTQDGPCEKVLKRGCEILIGGGEENVADFRQYVSVAPDGLKDLYRKLDSKPLDSYVTYDVYPMGPVAPSPDISQSIQDCVNIFQHKKLEREQQHNASILELSVKTCSKIQLVKRLDSELLRLMPEGMRTPPSHDVRAGCKDGPNGSSTLWYVPGGSRDIPNTAIAIALCRRLIKPYSREDLLAMKLFLVDGESRDDEKGKMGAIEPSPISHVEEPKISKGPQDPQTSPQRTEKPDSSENPAPVPGVWRRLWQHLPRKRGNKNPVDGNSIPQGFVSSIELAQRAVFSTRQKASRPEEPQRPYVTSPAASKRKNIRCGKDDTDLEEDKNFDSHSGITFLSQKGVRGPRPKEAAEAFVDIVIRLADVFGINDPDHVPALRIFWKPKDDGLMAFNRQGGYIYLNLAHYHEHHYTQIDKKNVIIDWYFIFAHEIAHNEAPQHDEYHEKIFAALCVSHLDKLRERFSDCSLDLTLGNSR